MWKVKDLAEWCNLKSTHDEDIVMVYTLDKYG